MTLPLPTIIHVDGVKYRVSYDDEVESHGTHVIGAVSCAQLLIRIDQTVAVEVQIATLWHEAIHAVLYHAGIEDHPEAMMRVLGYGLSRLMATNPELVAQTIQAFSVTDRPDSQPESKSFDAIRELTKQGS